MIYFPVLHRKIFYKCYFQTKNSICRYHYCQAKTQESDVLKGCHHLAVRLGHSLFQNKSAISL